MQEKKLTVLVIEDEQIFRTLSMQVFEGCDKVSAVNAAEGLSRFKEFCPDITLLDIGLPDKNGLDLLPELISYDPEAFIVMLTISRVSGDVKLARERGAAGYIIKPFTYQKVSQCIGKYKEYKKKLQTMTPQERAGKIIENLKVESLFDDLNKQIDDIIEHKTEHKAVHKIEYKDNHKHESRDEPKHESAVDILLKGWKVLFADDYLINRERADTQLRKLGCHIELAESGEDVLKKMSEDFYNVVLIDSKMSGMDGYEVARAIRREEAKKPDAEKSLLIIMVENADELDKRMWQKAGMNDFIKKPASFAKIRDTIKKHAKRRIDSQSAEYIN